ncbi:hypothetical protein [uncultured Flavobacterium sp.]|uniref:hypothetical protein n=1 Tax=uncultured Flavobacterium sp. TaxID=165435 RepID=UPI002634572B|nr:hypothetical protein [uncultured Flavobacterium sp.]
MTDTYKCAWCGRHFEKSASSKFLSGASMGISNLGKKYCSASCKSASEVPKQSIVTSKSNNSHHRYINEDNDLDLKLEEARLEHEQKLLEDKLSHERKMAEKKQKHELRLENIRSASEAIEKINQLDLGGDKPILEIISRQLEFCLTLASSFTSETFDVGGMKNLFNNAVFAEEKEKFNQSEKVVNAAIKKAELGLNKLRLCEPQDKAMNFYNLYKEQLNDSKIKQIERKWDHKVLEAKPPAWLMILCCMMLPLQLFVIYKLIELNVILPKKRKAELSQIK